MSDRSYGDAPLNAEALKKHRNKWVAIRSGEVVASADTAAEISSRARLKPGDALYHVPSSANRFCSVA